MRTIGCIISNYSDCLTLGQRGVGGSGEGDRGRERGCGREGAHIPQS